ncbi:hypothetical protein [Bifidobacterium sp. SO4]|uniref:hypothetical protein n=1 Tax=Bifidobacterium sp. SO4 TaxID=2809030 RepID=UPI001BDD7B7C|nr:hypothetical protein [Bifidobacterium sp. SO4]MBT1171366.1 hypothetical protein [Bifidobacterium sp. SO4]
MSRKHLTAVNRTIRAKRLDEQPQYAALVELARTVARQMDANGDDPASRLIAAYLSVLKDLNKAGTPSERECHNNTCPMDTYEARWGENGVLWTTADELVKLRLRDTHSNWKPENMTDEDFQRWKRERPARFADYWQRVVDRCNERINKAA